MRGKFISGYLLDVKQRPAWIIFLIFIVMFSSCLTLSVNDIDLDLGRQNRVVIKVKSTENQAVFTHLKTYGFIYLHKISPSTYIFDYNPEKGALQESLQIIKKVFTKELLAIEKVRIYKNIVQPWDRGKEIHDQVFVDQKHMGVNLESRHDSGISTVWSRGYTGKGVTVAVTGVGIDMQILDLQKNLNLDLSYNYVYNKPDITPEVYDSTQSKALLLTDQGNNIAGLIAAERDNGLCGAGIAYNSRVVGIKMIAVKMNQILPELSPTSDIVARALTHRLDDIDVYVNAWIPSSPFDQLDLATREAITHGATTGRRGLGVVYVVPAGPTGNMLSNNIHTITVGVLDVNGTKKRDFQSDASVLTSGLVSKNMVTTSHNNKCLVKTEGYTAAMSKIAAIIALGLEANPQLSVRDVQHLLMKASDYSQLRINASLKRNGAGRYFNEMFGFGALDAERFVNLSQTLKVNPLIVKSLEESVTTHDNMHKKKFEFCYSCDVVNDVTCLTTIEHVAISVKTGAPLNSINVVLVSPSGTSSVLINNQDIERPLIKAQLVSTNFWDETAFGTWVLTVISQTNSTSSFDVHSLTLFGTRNVSVSGHLPQQHICNMTTVSPPTKPARDKSGDDDGKKNIAIIVALPVGVVIMCGMLVFICKCGGTQGHVSTFGKPKAKEETSPAEKKQLFNRQISQDYQLHRQVSLLRQKSKQSSNSDEMKEDVEAEEAAEINGDV